MLILLTSRSSMTAVRALTSPRKKEPLWTGLYLHLSLADRLDRQHFFNSFKFVNVSLYINSVFRMPVSLLSSVPSLFCVSHNYYGFFGKYPWSQMPGRIRRTFVLLRHNQCFCLPAGRGTLLIRSIGWHPPDMYVLITFTFVLRSAPLVLKCHSPS